MIGEHAFIKFPRENKVFILDKKDAEKLKVKDENLSKINTPIGLRIVHGDGYYHWFKTLADITDYYYAPKYVDSVGLIQSFPSHRNEVNVYPKGTTFIVRPTPNVMPIGAENHYIKIKIYFLQDVWPPLTDTTHLQIYSYVANFLAQRGEPTTAIYFFTYRKRGATKLLVMTCYQCDSTGTIVPNEDPRARGPVVISIGAAHDSDIVVGGDYSSAYLTIGVNQTEFWQNGRRYRILEWWAQGGGVHPRLPFPVLMPQVTEPGVLAMQYYTGVEENELMKDYTLLQNYPNPFNATTEIEFIMEKEVMPSWRSMMQWEG